MADEATIVPPNLWGNEHFGVLLYVEARCVDYGGILDWRRMRPRSIPTTLKTGVILNGHGEVDCLRDLEAADFVRREGAGNRSVFTLTDAGWTAAHSLRRQRAEISRRLAV